MEEIFQILKQEHEEVKMLIEKGEATTSADTQIRQDLTQKLQESLIPHSKAEQKTLYAALEHDEEAGEIVEESEDEHERIEEKLGVLVNAETTSEGWLSALRELKEIVLHHVQEEESKLFESAEESLTSGELQDVVLRYKEERDKLKKKVIKKLV